MATKPLPAGTVNFPVNMPSDLRADIGRLAYIENAQSIGAFIREMIQQRVEQAKRAGKLVGQNARPAAVAGLVILGFIALAFASVSPAQPLVARRLRTHRVRVAAASFAIRVRQTAAA